MKRVAIPVSFKILEEMAQPFPFLYNVSYSLSYTALIMLSYFKSIQLFKTFFPWSRAGLCQKSFLTLSMRSLVSKDNWHCASHLLIFIPYIPGMTPTRLSCKLSLTYSRLWFAILLSLIFECMFNREINLSLVFWFHQFGYEGNAGFIDKFKSVGIEYFLKSL